MIKATRNPDGTFNIPSIPKGDFKNVPYIGTCRSYYDMAEDYKHMKKKICRDRLCLSYIG